MSGKDQILGFKKRHSLGSKYKQTLENPLLVSPLGIIKRFRCKSIFSFITSYNIEGKKYF